MLRYLLPRVSTRAARDCRIITSILTVALLLLIATRPAFAVDGKAGFWGSWLEMPIDARSAGMGDAGVACARGVAGHLLNPAATASVTRPHFASAYRIMDFDRKLSLAAFATPVRGEASMTFSWLLADYGAVPRRDNSGNLEEGEISQKEHQFGLLFAKKFSDELSFGFKVNYFLMKLDAISSNSAIVEGGIQLKLDNFIYDREVASTAPVRDITAGLAFHSVGSAFKISTSKYWEKVSTSYQGVSAEEKLPIRVALGGSARFLQSRLLGTLETEYHEKMGLRLRSGAEYEISRDAALRAGMNRGALTAGAGFSFRQGARHILQVDYAFQAARVEEGAEHLITIDIGF